MKGLAAVGTAAAAVAFGAGGFSIGGMVGGADGALAGGAIGLGAAGALGMAGGAVYAARGAGKLMRRGANNWSKAENAGARMAKRKEVFSNAAKGSTPDWGAKPQYMGRTDGSYTTQYRRQASGELQPVMQPKMNSMGMEKPTWRGKAAEWIKSPGAATLGANAMSGAIAGGIAGGMNPMGNDGMLGGAMKGAVIGGLAGAGAGAAAKNFGGTVLRANKEGNRALSIGKSGRLTYSNKAEKYGRSIGNVSMYAGAAAGLIGGSGRSKRHTTVGSNGWSQGTHPAYFGGY